ncbi:Similar to spop: Speckle-type POZ protein (Xenopus tropicalis) [Cotesia congregata]|uniref:Similar to spop: Speckle-type POZ protein (Xenopus tropicalis) n=1 Tax=Cotesia congregata TaxID=51543 RepID=A0A8J2HD29_COTCN|nr:Similar to spop: Speckle-type POZ protein (Xenopus tropicalis) [Cotesia congregata]
MDRGYVDNKEVQNLNYEWKSDSEDFHFGALLSDEFSSGVVPNKNTWQLNLHLNNHESSESNKWMSLFLKLTVPVIRKLVLETVKRNLSKKNKLWDQKDELLINDILTVGLQVLVYDISVTLPSLPPKIEKNQLANDIQKLYCIGEGSDIVIKVEGREFKAHKVLLLARSSVFSVMLAQDNTFRQTSEILVPNVKADIFEKLLEFIYTDQVRELDEFAENLLEVAQKFQVKELKHICEVSLSQFLSAENALRTLTLAKRRNSQKLADYVINFITVNATEVFNSNEYKQWEKEKLNPGLFIFQNSISKDKQSSKAEAKEKTSRLE